MNPDTYTLELTRHIRAPRERVFDAFVDEALLARWHCPRGMTLTRARTDARVDGRWSLEMQGRDRAPVSASGVYREVQRPARLVYTWSWGAGSPMEGLHTLIEIDFVERDGGTDLRMRHSGFPAAPARDAHGEGWQSVFNRLNDLLDARGTAATLTLLGSPRSSYVRSVRMGLAEKGVAYALEPLAPHSPEVDAIHPFGRIPCLRDGTTELWETAAILRYVDEAFEGPPLNPGMVAERARCAQWMSATVAYLYDPMISRYVLQYIFPRGEGGQPDRAVIERAAADMVRPLDALERAYQGRDYLAGGALSMADLMVTPILHYVARFPEGAQLLSDRPNIRRAQALMESRASFAATVPA